MKMPKFVLTATIFTIAIILLGHSQNAKAASASAEPKQRPGRHLKPFASEAALKEYLKKIKRKRNGYGVGYGSGAVNGAALPMIAADKTPATKSAAPAKAGSFGKDDSVSGRGSDDQESITNTQHAGVDEGGIVKIYGNYLVVLRRGRLFTIGIGDNSLKAVSTLNAFGPDIDPDGTWYDEMLISGDNVVVIGYSYDRSGTEVGLFKIDGDGRLKYRSTYHLRSNDYYSSRNYSSRLIGNKLIFYSPLYLELEDGNVFDDFPAVRRWHKGAKESEFRRIVSAANVYRADQFGTDDEDMALHTVTTCDLGRVEMSCTAQSVLGPSGDVFYVSPHSVYVWAASWDGENEKQHNRSVLFKMPLEGGEPSAIRVSGAPVDQFSFLEDDERSLNVLVQSDSVGDGMWGAEVSAGENALLRLSPSAFGDGTQAASRNSYRKLENADGDAFQNRFVGDYLLYGTGSSWGPTTARTESKLYTVNWKTGAQSTIALSHNVDRLDALGDDGIVVGTRGRDLAFSSIRLDGNPRIIDTYTVKNASQGETRSQGFFYKPDGNENGTLGLPITEAERPGYKQLREGSASVIFLRNASLRFSDLGSLRSAAASTAMDDDCQASCVDWYGNARAIFARGRVFALMGYELVEGALNSNQIREVRRLDFSPKQARSELK